MDPYTGRRGWLAALQIRPEEGGRTLLLFLYLFLASVVFTVGRTTRDTLFLSSVPNALKWLPFMWIGYGAGSAIISPLYTRVNDRFRRDQFNTAFAAGLAATYLLSWVLVQMDWKPVYSILFIWVEITSNLLIVQFWTLANELHDPREAKRLFGVIGSSRMIGIVICGLAVGFAVKFIGTAALLLVNAATLGVIAFLPRIIGRRYLRPAQAARAISSQPAPAGPQYGLRSPYILWIIVMIVATFIATTLGDYQFKAIAKAHYDKEALARFFSMFYVAVGTFAFFFHFFLSARILSRFGLLVGLLVMPAALALSCGWLLLSAGALLAASALKLSDNAFQFTIADSSLQLLYYPFPAQLKARLKALLEGAIKPVSYGLGGVVLVLLSAKLGPVKLSLVTLPLIVVWIGSEFFLRNHYVKALLNSLANRRLEPAGIDIQPTPETIRELAVASRSDNRYQAEFAFSELEKLDAVEARNVAEELVSEPARREFALTKLAELGESPELVAPFLKDDDAGVRAAAIEAYASLAEEDGIDKLTPFLESADLRESDAACAALMHYAGIDGVLVAGNHLNLLLKGEEGARVRAALILGTARVRDFDRPVKRLLMDASVEVRRAAIQAAGRLHSPKLLDILIEDLKEPALRSLATASIEEYGGRALDKLGLALMNPALPIPVRQRIPRLIRKINRPEAVSLLWAHAEEKDERLRIPILHHGERLQEKWVLALDKKRIGELLHTEGLTAAQWLARYQNLRPLLGDPLMAEALDYALYWCGRRTFSLLRLLYSPDAIGRIRYHLESDVPALRASALEALDNLLAKEREWVVPLLDPSDRLKSAHTLAAHFPEAKETLQDSMTRVFDGRYPYLAAAVFRARSRQAAPVTEQENVPTPWAENSLLREEVFALGSRLGLELDLIESRMNRESKENAMAILGEWRKQKDKAAPAAPAGGAMLTTLERVLFLKRVPLFAKVPGENLASLAQEAVPETYEAGQVIFRQGDPADAMYLIVQGSVDVEIEGKEIARLCPEECFGEMGILDQEPRSATITAQEPTTVLKITQADFFEIMAEWPEIARGIFKVLSHRLRHADAEIRKLRGG